jgi:glucosamine--fructose-6-phosphate aminotransferase (isomerizing)
MEDGEIAILTGDKVEIFDSDQKPIQRELFHVDWDITAAEKGGYEHFMLKEIFEQPRVVKDTLLANLLNGEIKMDVKWLNKDILYSMSRLYMVACGTAYHAGLAAKTLIERLARIPVIAEFGSEFRYSDPILDEQTLVILISQSGETADTIAALRLAKSRGARTLAIVNVMSSTIAREADDVIYTLAGPEIAVASTKAFTAQVVTLALMALQICRTLDIKNDETDLMIDELVNIPALINNVLDRQSHIKELAYRFVHAKNVFYIGRGLDYIIAMEGTLKLKELAYVHSESYAAGELKHGPLALLGPTTLVIGQLTQPALYEKTASNLQECKARGANILAITNESNASIAHYADVIFRIPDIHPLLSPVLANIPQQLFAYYMALELGNNVDKPRNLAKSVTVE